MARTLIWVTDGPKAGDFMEVDEAEADQAETEGWAQKTAGRDSMQMRQASPRGPHEKADAFLDRQAGGYENRELRAKPAPAPAPAIVRDRPPPEPAKAPAEPAKAPAKVATKARRAKPKK